MPAFYPYGYDTSIANGGPCFDCPLIIPKKVHRIWLAWDPNRPELPQRYQEYDTIFKAKFASWEIIEWDIAKVDQFIQKEYPTFWCVYNRYSPVKKHDAARYLILKKYGGVFLQHSLVFKKDIEPLLRGATAVFLEESAIANTIWTNFAMIPNHPILANIEDVLRKRKDLRVLEATGPNVITYLVRQYMKKTNDSSVRILPPKYMTPFDWDQKNQPEIKAKCIDSYEGCFELFPEAYAFTTWSKSWSNNKSKDKVLLRWPW